MAIIHIFDDPLAENKTTLEVEELQPISITLSKYIAEKTPDRMKFEAYDLDTGETYYIDAEADSYKAIVAVNNAEVDLDYIPGPTDIATVIFIPQSSGGASAWLTKGGRKTTGFLDVSGSIGMAIGAAVLAVAGAVAIVGTGGFGAVLGTLAIGATVFLLGAAQVCWGIYRDVKMRDNPKSDDALEAEQLLSISGGGNQELVDKRFPFVMGRHLINPGIVGSGYNTTYTTDFRGADGGQYVTQLYCVGYAPLRLTDFKLAETYLAYNRTSSYYSNGSNYEQKRPTLMHGLLHTSKSEFQEDESDGHDILRKWKNNDVHLEILQKGAYAESDTDRYGTIYPQVIEQLDVNANLLNIKDSLIEEVAAENKIYKGVQIPDGFMTNSVKFSRACPQRLEVEINFPNGLFATRTYVDGDGDSSIKYYNLPVRLAIQWRYVKSNQTSSDATSPEGWNDFDYIELSSPTEGVLQTIAPQVYTYGKKLFDYQSSLGKTAYYDKSNADDVKKFFLDDNWLYKGKTFDFGTENQPSFSRDNELIDPSLFDKNYYVKIKKDLKGDDANTFSWMKISKSEYETLKNYNYTDSVRVRKIYQFSSKNKYLTVYYYTNCCQLVKSPVENPITHKSTVSYCILTSTYSKKKTMITTVSKTLMFGSARDGFQDGWYVTKEFKIESAFDKTGLNQDHSKSICDNGFSPTDFEDRYGINERRYVVVKEFSSEQCRNMIDYKETGEITSNAIEVRVLRVNPCYFDEIKNGGGTKSWSGMSYEDLSKWTSLRSKVFDKTAFKEAMDAKVSAAAETADDSEISSYVATEYETAIHERVLLEAEKFSLARTLTYSKLSVSDSIIKATSTAANGTDSLYFITSTYDIYRLDVVVSDGKVNFSIIPIQKGEEKSLTISGGYGAAVIFNEDVQLLNWTAGSGLSGLVDVALSDSRTIKITDNGSDSEADNSYIEINGKTSSGYFFYATVKLSSDRQFYITRMGWNQNGESVSYDTPPFELFVQNSLSFEIPEALRGEFLLNENKYNLVMKAREEYVNSLIKNDSVRQKFIKVNYPSVYTSVDVKDYPLRPMSKEDMDKFVFVALTLKQDQAETGGSSLNSLSLIAESFNPKPDLNTDTDSNGWGAAWYPESIDKVFRWYKYPGGLNADGSKNRNKKIVEIDESEYNAIRESELEGLCPVVKSLKGNNFVTQLKDEVFSSDYFSRYEEGLDRYYVINSGITDKITRYVLDSDVAKKYISSNTASVFALALVGGHLGKDAKTYDCLNMYALTEAYKFYEDVTDGTPDSSSADGLKHITFNCNGVVEAEVKLETLMQKILLTGRSSYRRDDANKYEVIVGKKCDYPVVLFNQKNVLSISNNRTFDETTSGVCVNFIDETDNYSQNSLYIMADGEDYKNPTKEISPLEFQYVTNREQLWSLGRFNLAAAITQRETYTRTVGKIGYGVAYGDMVLLQDTTLLVGTDRGGRIQQILEDNDKIYGFITDEPLYYYGKLDDSGLCSQGCTIIQAEKYGQSRCVTVRFATSDYSVELPKKTVGGQVVIGSDGNPVYETYSMKLGYSNVCLLAFPIRKEDSSSEEFDDESEFYSLNPKGGDLVSFGYVGEIYQKAIITAVKPTDGDKFELSLAPYNEGLYEAGGELPVFESHMTQPERDYSTVDFSSYVTKNEVNEASETIIEKLNNLDVSGYIFDVSPEFQSIPVDSEGNFLIDSAVISAYLYYGDSLCDGVTYSATIDGETYIGEWEGNVCTIPASLITEKSVSITITAMRINGLSRSATVVIGKIANGTDASYYRPVLSDNKVKIVNDGTGRVPEQIEVTVLKQVGMTQELVEVSDFEAGSVYYSIDDGEDILLETSLINTDKAQNIITVKLKNPDGDLFATESIDVVADGTDGETTYLLDLTPEMQGVNVDSEGELLDSDRTVKIAASLYRGADGENKGITYSATINGQPVGEWTDNEVTIPASLFENDGTVIAISVTDDTGYTRTRYATVYKIYPGEDGEGIIDYDMVLSDNSIHRYETGVYVPSVITADKWKQTSVDRYETDYGTIVAIEEGSEDEVVVTGYELNSDTEYEEKETYYKKFEPFLLQIGESDEEVLGVDGETLALFFNQLNKSEGEL